MIFYITLFLILSIAPMIWLNYVFTKNDKILVNMPFTGLEFGKIILNELGLNDVKIEKFILILFFFVFLYVIFFINFFLFIDFKF